MDLQCKVLSECEYELLQVKTLASFIGVHDQIHVYSCSSVHSTCFDSMYFFFVLDCLIYVDIIPLWNPPWHVEGAYLTKKFKPLYQQEVIVGMMLLRSSRTNRSS